MIELPQFDTGEYEGREFLVADGGASLTVHIAERAPFVLHFAKLRWHQFTALYNCTAEQVKSSYFRLHEVVPSVRLQEFLANDRASRKAYTELHHYRIFLDETGCHEMFAESVCVGT